MLKQVGERVEELVAGIDKQEEMRRLIQEFKSNLLAKVIDLKRKIS